MTTRPENDPFAGDGEVAALARTREWAATPLGPVDQWPAALRAVVRTIMESPFPTNLWCGPELTLIYNDAYIPVLGDKHPQALGSPGAETWAEIWPTIGPMFQQIRDGGGAVFSEDAPFELRRADGDSDPESGRAEAADDGATQREGKQQPNAWFTFSLSPVRDEDGHVIAFLNVVHESTSRVQAELDSVEARRRAERAESQLREIFTQAPSFMAVVKGPEHVFEYVNEAYYQLVSHRELIGKPVMEALPEIREQGFRELLDDVLRTGEPYVGRETRILFSTPAGGSDERFLDFVYYPITDGTGDRVGVVAHGYDVTEHVRSRKEAQRARMDAEEASQAKSQFLANMSHEIRTPINAIMGYTDLLELGTGGPLTEKQRTQLDRLRASSQHLLALVNDVLDVAKVEAGHMDLETEPAPASQSVASALAVVRPQASEKEIQLENRCDPESDISYTGDENRVRQILVNLLSNAVKFTDTRGRIIVECGVTDDRPPLVDASREGRLTYIRVADTGIGIAADDLEEVFKPFIQADRGHTRAYGGTGLGLTISRHLARLMGGDLTAASEQGSGSTFTLWLPTHPTPVGDPLVEESGEVPPAHVTLVGEALQEQVPDLLERFVRRLREDMKIPRAMDMSHADLQDHASSFLTDIAQSLIVLENAEVIPERLLRDGSEIQRVIAELHGRQRARLGWAADALAREWEILVVEMEKAVREKVPPDVDVDAALDLMRRFTDRARRISLRSHRHMVRTA